jgi:hypothetical protein
MSGFNLSNPDAKTAGLPPEPVGLTVHRMEPPELPAGRATRAGRWKMLAVLAVCAAPVIASYVTYYFIRPQGRSNYAELMTPPKSLPQTPVASALDGKPFDLSKLKGQWLLVVASEAACGATCEKQLWLQRQLRQTLGRERDRVDELFIVTDNGPLSPQLVAALAADPSMTVLRIPEATLRKWMEPAAGRGWADHVYVVDPMGQWMMRTPPDPEPAKFKKDMEKLLRASSSWDRAGRE